LECLTEPCEAYIIIKQPLDLVRQINRAITYNLFEGQHAFGAVAVTTMASNEIIATNDVPALPSFSSSSTATSTNTPTADAGVATPASNTPSSGKKFNRSTLFKLQDELQELTEDIRRMMEEDERILRELSRPEESHWHRGWYGGDAFAVFRNNGCIGDGSNNSSASDGNGARQQQQQRQRRDDDEDSDDNQFDTEQHVEKRGKGHQAPTKRERIRDGIQQQEHRIRSLMSYHLRGSRTTSAQQEQQRDEEYEGAGGDEGDSEEDANKDHESTCSI